MWKGSRGLLLTEYLENKIKLQEFKRLPLRFRLKGETEKIVELEKVIKEFLSMLGVEELRSLILMGLDIE